MVFNTWYLITIPTTLGSKPAPMELVDSVRREVKVTFAEAFGGFTETEGQGGYVAQDGTLIEEKVYQVMAWASHRRDEVVYKLAWMVKDQLQQETIMFQINGQAYVE